MVKKTFKYGKHTCKAYKKPVGKGWEVGLTLGTHPIFVGNFIHTKEANTWFAIMTAEVRKFTKRYSPAAKAPTAWLRKFWSNSMYKAYYTFLDRQFSKYNSTYSRAVRADERRFSNFRKAGHNIHNSFRRAA